MKDRQLAKRIQHQFAKYDSMGRLTCRLCNGLTVKSEALWPSHLTSKPHRLAHQRHQATLNETNMDSSSTSTSKRKPEDLSPDDKAGDSPSQEKKVRLNVPSSDHEDEEPALKSLPKPSLPADFFDDPSQAPQLDNQSEGPEEEDPEWKAFQASLQEPPSEDNSADLFAKASMIAEPVFYQPDQKASSQLPSQDLEDGDPSSLEQDHAEEEEEDPIEKKIREEKEEIMDRIQNEEREQLEADERVLRMKARINAFRARRRKPTNVD